jgi:hypothetical protein
VATYLARWPLPGDVDRDTFVRRGVDLMDAVERDLTTG